MFELHDIGLTASGQRYEITDEYRGGELGVTLIDDQETTYITTSEGTYADDERLSLTPATHTRVWLALYDDLSTDYFFDADTPHADGDKLVIALTDVIVPRQMVGLSVTLFGDDE